MWLAAFFGMATIYGEAVLAQTFKTKDETGHVIGGPVYYIRQAFKGTFGKILAGFFALAIIFALGFTGNMVQSNAISNAFQEALGIPTWIVGVVLAVVAAFIFLGGVTRIAAVTEKLVPVMACFYLVGGLVMLIANITNLPHAFALILRVPSTPRPSWAAPWVSACGRPCATAWPGACSPTRQAWVLPPTPTPWPRWKSPRTRALWPWFVCLSTPLWS